MENINVKIEAQNGELTIREGKALDLKEPKHLNFSGLLFAPADFVENRKELLDPTSSHVIVDSEVGEIILHLDEKNHYRDVLTGKLKKSSVIDLFGINKEKFYSDKELAKFFRKAVYYFLDAEKHKAIVSSLMNFTAKVNTVIEKADDKRGNIKSLLEKTVDSSVPESFVMKAPLFEGYPEIQFTVLIGAEATTSEVKFFLESPELFKLEEEEKRKLLQVEVERFKKFGAAILYK